MSATSNTNRERLKSLLRIQSGEESVLVHFLVLFGLLGISMAIGKTSADALFLKRYGVEHLPTMFVLLSAVMASVSIVYAAFVDRISPEAYFKRILFLLCLVLLVFWVIIAFTEIESIFPAYYILFRFMTEIIVVHAAFYLDKNFDTMQSKRLTPIVLAGYQSGNIIGGFVIAGIAPTIGVEHAPLLWMAVIFYAFLRIYHWHQENGVSPFYLPPSRSSRHRLICAFDEVRHGIGFMGKSPLLRDASFALFFMVLSYYILNYCTNLIYTTSFTEERDLSLFLGLLVAGTNALALLLQLFVSNRALEKLGVRKTKYIYPISLLATYIALVVNPGLYAAIAGSISRESIMPAFRNPSRQMFYSVLPDYMKGRARATAVVLVMPLSLLVCGSLLLMLDRFEMAYVYYLGLGASALYLLFCYRMGQKYISTLIGNMRERLYIPQGTALDDYTGHSQEFLESLLTGLNSDDDAVSLSYARLLMSHYEELAIEPILDRIANADDKYADQMLCLLADRLEEEHAQKILDNTSQKDDHFRATTLNIILRNTKADNTLLLDECFNSASPRIQATAINAVISDGLDAHAERAYNTWLKLLSGDTKSNVAALDLIHLVDRYDDEMVTSHYKRIITELQEKEDPDLKYKLYLTLQRWSSSTLPDCDRAIIRDINHHSQRIRAEAVKCLHLCGDLKNIENYIITALDDGHPKVREAAITLLHRHAENPLELFLQWSELNVGTPRAQKEIAQQLIDMNIDNSLLRDLAESKINYATQFFEAYQVISQTETDSKELQVIRLTMQERSNQMIDLILMLLHPMVNKDILSVIRAGLRSNDVSHKANAREAIQDIDDRAIVQQINRLIEQHSKIHSDDPTDQSRASLQEIITWCTNINDHWLQFCGQSAQPLIESEANP